MPEQGEWGTCPGCARRVPSFELVDTSTWAELAATAACGACRGQAAREGRVTRAEMVRRLGGAKKKVEWMQTRETRIP